ncbi:N-acetyllactosaminide beta-1,6-N-acetylglucosaminyl-transferase [Amia ocellicauda]|uniref:N-acetyllactosaminide beta-1,6-N-acetylglucosaminyl-transferase n=1 Tax=Amia ocellicauda TaxID=2972642 RepID=UPI0034641A9D
MRFRMIKKGLQFWLLLLSVCFSLLIAMREVIMENQKMNERSKESKISDYVCSGFVQRSKRLTWTSLMKPSPLNVSCEEYITNSHFITETLSSEEEAYPLAFIITVHKEFDMFERVFRAIYAPHNVYCIHIDEKASKAFKAAVETLINCFPNSFLASKMESVVYAGMSRLQADINCLKDLVSSGVQWKYVINLCGQDFPLMTNLDMIRHLKSYKEKNLTPGILPTQFKKQRIEFVHREYVDNNSSRIVKITKTKSPPPHNITTYSGSAYYALTHEFATFVLQDKRATDLLEWSKDTYSPDEQYWVTLNRIPDAPNSMPNGRYEGKVRAIKWIDHKKQVCHGRFVRGVCVYGPGDLKWLFENQHMFANKFELKTYPPTVECLELKLRERALNNSEVTPQPSWYF